MFLLNLCVSLPTFVCIDRRKLMVNPAEHPIWVPDTCFGSSLESEDGLGGGES